MSRNIDQCRVRSGPSGSRPARGVWVGIRVQSEGGQAVLVAPREGRVSRNSTEHIINHNFTVAPREGRVSRNRKISESREQQQSRAPRGACE